MTIDPPLPSAEETTVDSEAPLPEQPETDLTPPAEPSANPATDSFAAARAQLVGEIRGSRRLPRGLRERLAQAVESLSSEANQAAPSLRVTEALALLEESLPPQLVLAAETLEPATHPGGEGFFTGDPRRFSAAEAARIAAEQLAATGFAAAGGRVK